MTGSRAKFSVSRETYRSPEASSPVAPGPLASPTSRVEESAPALQRFGESEEQLRDILRESEELTDTIRRWREKAPRMHPPEMNRARIGQQNAQQDAWRATK